MDRNDRAAGSSAGEEAHVSHPELLRYGVLVRPTPIDRGREPCLTRQPRESHQQKVADRSSRMDLRKNEDGSVDIYTGPKALAGFEKTGSQPCPVRTGSPISASTIRPRPTSIDRGPCRTSRRC